jgi:hypothetical protein
MMEATTFILILLGIHAAECVYFRKKIANSSQGAVIGTILTLLFGIVYLRRIKG